MLYRIILEDTEVRGNKTGEISFTLGNHSGVQLNS